MILSQVDKQWLESFTDWLLDNVINYTAKTQAEADIFFKTQSMELLVKAFTHQTYDNEDNYELLELEGDALLSLLLIRFFKAKFPSFGPREISDMKAYYMSDQVQSDMFMSTGGHDYIRIPSSSEGIRKRVAGDVFESLFAAVFRIVETEIPGRGQEATTSLFLHFYADYDFNVDLSKGSYKTRVLQIFNRLRLGHPRTNIRADNKTSYADVALTEEQMIFLEDHDIRLPSQYIGSGVGPDIGKAEETAFKAAHDHLKKYGVTTEWAVETKLEIDLSSKALSREYEKAKVRLQREGYVKIAFETSRKISSQNETCIMMIGVRSDGTRKTLMSGIGSLDSMTTKRELLKAYNNGSENRLIEL